MRKPKVQAETTSNQHCRNYHTNFRLTNHEVSQLIEGRMMIDEKEAFDQSSDSAKKLAVGVMGIEGIKTFCLNAHELRVVKAPLFEWSEIEPQIIGLIQMVGHELLGEEIQHIKEHIEKHREFDLNVGNAKQEESPSKT